MRKLGCVTLLLLAACAHNKIPKDDDPQVPPDTMMLGPPNPAWLAFKDTTNANKNAKFYIDAIRLKVNTDNPLQKPQILLRLLQVEAKPYKNYGVDRTVGTLLVAYRFATRNPTADWVECLNVLSVPSHTSAPAGWPNLGATATATQNVAYYLSYITGLNNVRTVAPGEPSKAEVQAKINDLYDGHNDPPKDSESWAMIVLAWRHAVAAAAGDPDGWALCLSELDHAEG